MEVRSCSMAWKPTTNGTSLSTRTGNASTSSSRLNTEYELSDDLNRRQIECLEKKYGGRLRVNSAATKIQRAFRIYQLQKQFKTALHRETSHEQRSATLQPYLKYQPTSSLRTQLYAIRSGQINGMSPRKNSTPCIEQNSSGRNFTEAVLSPRLSQRHAFISPPTAYSTPNRVGGISPVVWVQHSNQKPLTPINLSARSSKTIESPVSSFTPSESVSMSPSHVTRDGRINCQNSTSSNSIESQNFVQMDSMLPSNGIHDTSTPPSDNHQQNSTTSSSSVDTSDQSIQISYSHSSSMPSSGYKLQNRQLFAYKNDNQEQKRRRMYRIALNIFNKKPDRGIQMLIDWRYVDSHPVAIAKFILSRRGLSKKMIGEFLGTLRSELHAAVLRAVFVEIEIKGQEVDEALRTMIYFFQLPTEAQKIDYILQAFAKRYYECNSYRLPQAVTQDAIYVLAFAIIMLNTDQHSPSIKASQRMTVNQFVKNTWGAFETHAFDQDMLVAIYERIKKTEICPGNDHVTQVSKVEQTISGRDKPRLVEQYRRLICYCRVNEVASPTKKQALSAHQREIFLFNDMILITKAANNRRKDQAQYILKYWTPLLGLEIDEFDSEIFPYAMQITFPNKKAKFLLNAKNANDRVRFIADVRESVAECQDMEHVRLVFELNRQDDSRRETSRAMSSASSLAPTVNSEHL